MRSWRYAGKGEKMALRRVGWKRLVVIIFLAMLVYSFLPMVSFWLAKDTVSRGRNEDSVEKLKDNKGSYFSFLVFGDNHSGLIFNDAVTIKEIWHMNREDRFLKLPVDFVLNTGDVSLNGKRAHFMNYAKIMGLIKYPVISVIGNHDGRKFFEEFCGKSEFAFADRNSYFIVVDNEQGDLRDTQFRWLEERLKEAQAYDHTFVALHKPPFDPYQQDWYSMDSSPWAYRFRKLCAKYGVDMVFSGHKHMFKHARFDGVDYFVSGGGGMLLEIPEEDGGYHHYMRVEVNHDYVTYEVRKVSPPLWEWATYYLWKKAVYWCRNFYGSGYIFGKNTKIEPLRTTEVNDENWMGM
ncbi:MAG: metallophosphoesterase [Candidatus Omnitrophota bacterium]